MSALAAVGRRRPSDGPIHVTVPADRCPRRTPACVVAPDDARRRRRPSRRGSRRPPAREPGRRVGLGARAAAAPERSAAVARQAVIEASARRRVTRRRAADESADARSTPAARRCASCSDLVDGGCESELEIWGVTHVLPGPPACRRSCSSTASARRRARSAWTRRTPRLEVAVELDGAAFHGSRGRPRERDLRRDAALAAARAGWSCASATRRLTTRPGGLPARDRGCRQRRRCSADVR